MRDGDDPGKLGFCPQFVEVVYYRGIFESGMGPYPPWVRRDLGGCAEGLLPPRARFPRIGRGSAGGEGGGVVLSLWMAVVV